MDWQPSMADRWFQIEPECPSAAETAAGDDGWLKAPAPEFRQTDSRQYQPDWQAMPFRKQTRGGWTADLLWLHSADCRHTVFCHRLTAEAAVAQHSAESIQGMQVQSRRCCPRQSLLPDRLLRDCLLRPELDSATDPASLRPAET